MYLGKYFQYSIKNGTGIYVRITLFRDKRKLRIPKGTKYCILHVRRSTSTLV